MTQMPEMRILTWNIWWRFGPWEERSAGIAATLRSSNADVICLQEAWAKDGRNQASELADDLGYDVVASCDGSPGNALGNAVLSRWPITHHEITALPLADGTPGHRTLVRARVATPDGTVDIYSTHLAFRFDESALRIAQLQTASAAIAETRRSDPADLPPVLCGDLNATPDSDEIRMLTGQHEPADSGLVFTDAWTAVGNGPGHTWDTRNPHLADSTWPDRRLDYVLVAWPREKPLGNPIRARLTGARRHNGVWPSDHLGVIVDLVSRADA